jgi:hypothetical protein
MESPAIFYHIISEAFIINWQNRVYLCEKHIPPSDHFSDGQRRIMLEDSVNDIM